LILCIYIINSLLVLQKNIPFGINLAALIYCNIPRIITGLSCNAAFGIMMYRPNDQDSKGMSQAISVCVKAQQTYLS